MQFATKHCPWGSTATARECLLTRLFVSFHLERQKKLLDIAKKALRLEAGHLDNSFNQAEAQMTSRVS